MQWFIKDLALDVRIREQFSIVHQMVMAENDDGDDEKLLSDANAALAAIIVLDQFSRNMFRDSAKMFASDEKALRLAKYVCVCVCV